MVLASAAYRTCIDSRMAFCSDGRRVLFICMEFWVRDDANLDWRVRIL
jgi:hypothetical protein